MNCLSDDDGAQAIVEGAAISNLRAAKTLSAEFRLESDVVVPFDGNTMKIVEKYYKANCFLTMDPIERELVVEVGYGGSGEEITDDDFLYLLEK